VSPLPGPTAPSSSPIRTRLFDYEARRHSFELIARRLVGPLSTRCRWHRPMSDPGRTPDVVGPPWRLSVPGVVQLVDVGGGCCALNPSRRRGVVQLVDAGGGRCALNPFPRPAGVGVAARPEGGGPWTGWSGGCPCRVLCSWSTWVVGVVRTTLSRPRGWGRGGLGGAAAGVRRWRWCWPGGGGGPRRRSGSTRQR
jgi:hypothetical protein